MAKFDVILSTDRSLMTNHHGSEFLGFGTTMPLILPRWFIQWLFCPPMRHENGIVWQAPYGIRRVEAALLHFGFNVGVIDPDWVPKYLLEGAKYLVLRHHDWFGLNPPTSTWTALIDKPPLNVYLFQRFMEKVMKVKEEADFKIIVGGPAVWEWLHFPEKLDEYQIDVVIDSNGDREDVVVAQVLKRMEKGLPVPRYIKQGIRDGINERKLFPIVHASVNGLVEIGMGCPRRCAFCSVGNRNMLWYSLDFIEKEILANVREGVKNGILASSDNLLYGSRTVIPNPEAVIKVNKLAKKYWDVVSWSHCTLAAAAYNKKLVREVAEIIIDGEKQRFMGVEVGVESGSVNIMRKHMPAKPKPFPVEKWPDVVEEAFALFHEVGITPAATIVVGLPGETEDDVVATIELVERLKPYRALIVPMFFVPMGPSRLGKEEWFRNIGEIHVDLLMACLKHDLYWAKDLMQKYLSPRMKNSLVKAAVKWFLNYAERGLPKAREKLLEIIEKKKRKLKELEAEKAAAVPEEAS